MELKVYKLDIDLSMDKVLKDLAIYGMGGKGREIACMIAEINAISPQWNFIGFFDDGDPESMKSSSQGKLLGNMDTLNAWPTELCVALCFGMPKTIEGVRKKITNPLVKFPNIIHPNFRVSDTATFCIGEGNIVTSGCYATCNVSIGNYNLLNGNVGLGHDVTIGNFNAFMPGAKVSGGVTIGNCNLFGAMSFVKQRLTVPDHVTLGPLSPLLTQPRSGSTYLGNPAKIFKY